MHKPPFMDAVARLHSHPPSLQIPYDENRIRYCPENMIKKSVGWSRSCPGISVFSPFAHLVLSQQDPSKNDSNGIQPTRKGKWLNFSPRWCLTTTTSVLSFDLIEKALWIANYDQPRCLWSSGQYHVWSFARRAPSSGTIFNKARWPWIGVIPALCIRVALHLLQVLFKSTRAMF